ncbi:TRANSCRIPTION FACTOR IBH1-LIKE 1 [Salix purpurea]|uniref:TRANSCRIPTION FACTOR IBH1-LIKE 1 n=1 Tax=Salix purpurea TaxID=77065 RepID=A0A9Q0ZHN1_SALPP|nr:TRANSCRIPTION FACTOR IBH1-LIKE 1 [Salix purpurea]
MALTMSSRPTRSKISLKKTERRRRPHSGACKAQRSVCNGGLTSSSKVSDKLEALKNLIPATSHNGEIVKPDQLFKETADYILLLKTQVVLLQGLVEFYGSSTTGRSEQDNSVL